MEQQQDSGWGEDVQFKTEPIESSEINERKRPYGSQSPSSSYGQGGRFERREAYERRNSYDRRDDYQEQRKSRERRDYYEGGRESFYSRDNAYEYDGRHHQQEWRGPYERRDDRPEKRFRRDYNQASYPANSSMKKEGLAELAKHSSFLGMHEFLEYQNHRIPESEASKLYTEYKELYLKYQLEIFYQIHCNDAWFCELFDSAKLIRKRAEVHKIIEKEQEKFVAQLEAGYFNDCSLDEQYASDEIVQQDQEQSVEFVDSPENITEVHTEIAAEIVLESQSQPKRLLERVTKLSVEQLDYPSLLIRNIMPNIGRDELADSIKKVVDFKVILLSESNQENAFTREGWIIFESGTDIAKTFELFEGRKLKVNENAQVEISLCPISSGPKIRTCPEICRTTERIEKDLSLAIAICEKFCKETELSCPIPLESPVVADNGDEMEQKKKRLDLLITYMRRVHFFCFYCGIQFETSNELIQRCGNIHIRKIHSMKSQAYLDGWIRRHEDTLQALLGNSDIFSKTLPNPIFNTKSIADELSALIFQVEAEKFRCILCNKMFKGPEFVEKHIRLKHPERVQEIESAVNVYSNFTSDFYRLRQFVSQYFSTSTSVIPETAKSGQPEYQRERRSSRDLGRPSRSYHHHHRESAPLPPPSGKNQYEGRRIKTYADLDAPVVEDSAELFY